MLSEISGRPLQQSSRSGSARPLSSCRSSARPASARCGPPQQLEGHMSAIAAVTGLPH